MDPAPGSLTAGAMTGIGIGVGLAMMLMVGAVYFLAPDDADGPDPGPDVDEAQARLAQQFITALAALETNLATPPDHDAFDTDVLASAQVTFEGDRLGVSHVDAERRFGQDRVDQTTLTLRGTVVPADANITLTCSQDRLSIEYAGRVAVRSVDGDCTGEARDQIGTYATDALLLHGAGLLFGELPDIAATDLQLLSTKSAALTGDVRGNVRLDTAGRVAEIIIRTGDDTVTATYAYGAVPVMGEPEATEVGILGVHHSGGSPDRPEFTLSTTHTDLPRGRFEVRIYPVSASNFGNGFDTHFYLSQGAPTNGDFSFIWHPDPRMDNTIQDGDVFSLRHRTTDDFLASYQIVLWDRDTDAPVAEPAALELPVSGLLVPAGLAVAWMARSPRRFE